MSSGGIIKILTCISSWYMVHKTDEHDEKGHLGGWATYSSISFRVSKRQKLGGNTKISICQNGKKLGKVSKSHILIIY